MVRVTVSGHPGSGTSTLVAALAERYGWSTLNGGQIFREEAARRGLDLGAFGRLCGVDSSVGRGLDARHQERMQADGGPDVVESRMQGCGPTDLAWAVFGCGLRWTRTNGRAAWCCAKAAI